MIRHLLLLLLSCLLLSSLVVTAQAQVDKFVPLPVSDSDEETDDDYDSADFENPNWSFYEEICCNLWYRAKQCCGFDSDNKYIFVTSTEFSADLTKSGVLGSVTGADAICQEHASNAGYDGLFKAWIATNEHDAPRERFSRHRGNYVRPDNAVVYQCWDRLVSGKAPSNSFWMDESKQMITSSTQGAVTNVDEFGRYYENSENVIGSCMQFTYDDTRGSDLTPSEAGVGLSEQGFGFRPDRFIACNQVIRLICVQM